MNERQPYEQHLAEKMQQLPPPLEPDKAWEKMKVLLDNELPRGNGTGGNGRWWIIGMIAGILFIGAWMFHQQWTSGENIVAKKPTAVNTSPNASRSNQESIAKLPSTEHRPGESRTTTDDAASETNASGNRNSRANIDAARTDQAPITAKKQNNPDDQASGETAHTDVDVGKIIRSPHPISQNNKLPAYTENFTPQSSTVKNKNGKDHSITSTTVDIKPKTGTKINSMADSRTDIEASDPVNIIARPFLIETDQLLPNQQMKSQRESNALMNQQLAVKMNSPKKISRKADKPDRTFSVGLSLPLAFPLADQQALGYNFRGGSNTVSDYIPSPHMQYHVNKKTYFQTEVQVVSPQFIRPLLMYQQKTMMNPNTWMYNSVYARKLYYFNLPVSVYHSPMPNFYLGTGLQFSSLMSGVAMYEDKKVYGNQEMVVRQSFNRINYDSLTNRMSNSEVRLLLDVNYYWQRFTVGLRYNQAFGNYASFRLNNNTGFTYDKNKALFFYLRYNIWEDKKRNTPARSMLTLK